MKIPMKCEKNDEKVGKYRPICCDISLSRKRE